MKQLNLLGELQVARAAFEQAQAETGFQLGHAPRQGCLGPEPSRVSSIRIDPVETTRSREHRRIAP
ncbi:hypothetical protein [Sphingomonas kyeonggiensis]|uniref:Uncharacterized protein n=1 Tax=Sphingomonas kyeonggiensis TaxID=1268553 RepID=A0A7W6JTV7_9SPHN|nr:hypothetical protein [Sphingomonas kyeonggiensis]MBB4099420.1 hypothetical protein [Sphingomonas kyeonggiensis]